MSKKIGITVETFGARPKKYKSFGQARGNKTMLPVGKGPPAPFSESRHWDWLSGEGQPANRGSFLRSCGWRRQSSEVLYVTYQHGLPFNQRVERKDKVKPSSAGTGNSNRLLQQSHVRADKRVRHVTGFCNKTNCSIGEKEVEGLKWSEGISQVRPGQNGCGMVFKFVLHNMKGT